MNDAWKTEVEQDIKKLLDGKPTAQNAMLLAALIEIDEYLEEEGEGSEPAARSVEPEEDSYMTDIDEELSGSKHYYDLWLETKRPEYKEMSRQELSHMEQLLKFAREDGALSDEDFRAVKAKHGSMLAKLA